MGKAGLRLSEISYGAWVTFGDANAEDTQERCMTAAYEAGVNFFDNAEAYANGQAEVVMGRILKAQGLAARGLGPLDEDLLGDGDPTTRALA